MYAYLQGSFTHKTPARIILETHGVGYEVHVSLHTYSAIQSLSEGRLYTYLQVKEDAHVLFGFATPQEKDIFLQLISVSGVGASTARMMLSSVKPEDIVHAIQSGDHRSLEKVKGIGKKTAERLVLELRDKIGAIGVATPTGSAIPVSKEKDALDALVSLGITKNMAEQAIQKVIQSEASPVELEELIKKALKAI
jgi:Holliday junction DNA helicase RuvA